MSNTTLSNLNPEAVYVVGDVHGNSAFLDYTLAHAGRNNCSVVVQLGDFGYWEHTRRGARFLDQAARAAETCNVTLLFIDGNHENHALLNDLYAHDRVGPDGVAWVRPRIGWITRGARWQWQGVSFGALGGAASVDREHRVPGWSWWANEVIEDRDVKALGGERLDVLLSHDAPTVAGMVGRISVSREDQQRCDMSRGQLDRAVAMTQPTLLIHGHWHLRHTLETPSIRIEGLAHDQAPFSEAVARLALPSLEMHCINV